MDLEIMMTVLLNTRLLSNCRARPSASPFCEFGRSERFSQEIAASAAVSGDSPCPPDRTSTQVSRNSG
jgi:hypothetical protein